LGACTTGAAALEHLCSVKPNLLLMCDDLLVDHSTLIQINGESYRRKRARQVGDPAKS
jgi:hypothetical protein